MKAAKYSLIPHLFLVNIFNIVSKYHIILALAGKGTEDKDAVSVRTDHPVPPNCGLFYFEVTVVSKGRKGYIGMSPLKSNSTPSSRVSVTPLPCRNWLLCCGCEAGPAARLGAKVIWVPWG